VKTDRLDARTLARLSAAGSLDGVWMPDQATWVMRRLLFYRLLQQAVITPPTTCEARIGRALSLDPPRRCLSFRPVVGLK
jgi:hypothetical protein